MSETHTPALRDGRDEVCELKPDGSSRSVLGVRRPDEADRRVATLRRLGQSASPRDQHLVAIDAVLPQRSQTILSHEVDAALRARLNGGGAAPHLGRRLPEPQAHARCPPGGANENDPT